MAVKGLVHVLAILSCTATIAGPAFGQSDSSRRPLVVASGRPLDIALDERVTVHRVGQPVAGIVVEPVFRTRVGYQATPSTATSAR